MTNNATIGSLVKATAGRDADKFFIIIGIIDSDYVLIADGKNRSVKKPKKKKIKHLKMQNIAFENIASLVENKKLLDADVRKAIKTIL